MQPRAVIGYTYLTIGTLVGLVLGFALGLAADQEWASGATAFIAWMTPGVKVWLTILKYLAALLAATFVITAIVGARDRKNVGTLAGIAAFQHLIFLVIAATVALTTATLIGFFPEIQVDTLLSGIEIPTTSSQVSTPTLADRMTMMFENPVSAILRPNVLAVIMWSIVFGILLSFLPEKNRHSVINAFGKASRLTQVAIGAVLLFMPLVVLYVVFQVDVLWQIVVDFEESRPCSVLFR